DSPEALGRRLDHLADIRLDAEVDGEELRIGAQRLHLRQGIGALGLVPAGKRDPRTFPYEAANDAAADSRIAARDQGDLVFEPHRAALLFILESLMLAACL